MYRCAACDSPSTFPCRCPLASNDDRPVSPVQNQAPVKKWIGSGEDAMFP